jgi:hypothetical protein
MKKVILFYFAIGACFSLQAQNWKATFGKSIEYVNKSYDGGDKYKGQTTGSGVREGLGVYIWSSGSYHFGDWSSGDMNGYGIKLVSAGYSISNCSNCAVYVGNFSSDNKSGKGSCYDSLGNLIYYGNFSTDKPTETYPSNSNYSAYKFQTIEYNSGDKYVGETKNGLRHGYGIYVWKSGSLWFGNWENSERRKGIELAYDADWKKQSCQGDDCTELASSHSHDHNHNNSNYSNSSHYSNNNNSDNSPNSITTKLNCSFCFGTGKMNCICCAGMGMKREINYYTYQSYYVTCQCCAGQKKVTCTYCGGLGYTTITVDVPATPVAPVPSGGGYYNPGGSSDGSSGSGYATCKGCGGTGRCKSCGGSGKYNYKTDCAACRGTGNCGVCYGSGKIRL